MGRDKAFLRWKGRRLIDCQLTLLQSLEPAEIFISGRPGIDYGPTGVPVLYDDLPDAGPLGGIAALLGKITAPHLLVLAVDMPAMTAKLLREIAARRESSRGVAPRLGGKWEPLAAVYPRELAGNAKTRLETGHRSLRNLVEEAVAGGRMRPYPVPPAQEQAFFNWNRLEEESLLRFPKMPPDT